MPVISTIAAATARAFGAFKAAAGGAADEFFNYVTLLLHGDGTNGAQNNTFLDSSTNNFTITRNGNTTQGTFSPFSQDDGKWSAFFGASDVVATSSTGIIPATGDFTIECFVFTGSNETTMLSQGTTGSGGRTAFGITSGKLYLQIGSIGTSTGDVPLNQWVHVAATRTGSSVTFYINGSASGTATLSASVDNAVFRVGGNWATASGLYSGYISNVRVSNVVRTISVPTTPFVNDANTRILLFQSNRFKDNSSNAYALTVSGTTSIQPFSPFAPSAAYSAAVNGGSGYFDGSGDYLSVPDGSWITLGTNDFTAEAWIYNTVSTGASQYICGQGNSAGQASSISFEMYLNSSRTLSGGIYVGSQKYATSSGTISLNTWTHVALVRDGGNVRLYINGVQDGVNTTAGTSSVVDQSSQFSLARGGEYNGLYFNGFISGFRFINGTCLYPSGTTFTVPTSPPTGVTNTQLLTNFTNAGILDNTGRNVLETVGNAQISTSVKKFGTGSLAFDGSGDRLLAPSNPNFDFGSGNWTIECWVNPSSLASINGVFAKRLNADTTVAWMLSQIGTNGTITTLITTNGSGWGLNATTTSAVSASTWTHLAWVRNGADVSVYVGGVKNTLSSSFSGSIFAGTEPFVLGATGTTGSFLVQLNGYIDDLRITKGAARYTANFTPPTAAFEDQ